MQKPQKCNKWFQILYIFKSYFISEIGVRSKIWNANVIKIQNDLHMFEKWLSIENETKSYILSLNVDRIFNKLLDNDKKMHEKIRSI